MTDFKNTEKNIINLLYRSPFPLSTSEIASELQISWITANHYIKNLEKMGYVIGEVKGNSLIWKLRRTGEPRLPERKVKRIKGIWQPTTVKVERYIRRKPKRR